MAEKTISDRTYRVEPMPATAAIALYADLMRVVTGGTGRVPAIMAALIEGDQAFAETAALAALSDILRQTGTDDLMDVLKRILGGAQVKRPSGMYSAVDFDDEFTGRIETVVPVARFVLEVNFADFFSAGVGSGILGGLRAAFQKVKSAE